MPAHGTATATVSADIVASPQGIFGGELVTSRDGHALFDTPIGYTKRPEEYRLGLNVLDRAGAPYTNRFSNDLDVEAINLDTGAPTSARSSTATNGGTARTTGR